MGNCVGKDSKASNAKGNQPGRAAAAAANLKRFDDLLEQVTDPTLERVVRPKQRYENHYVVSSKVLGVGKWGSVKLATQKVSEKKVAFKTLKKKTLAERPARISPTIEVECHARAGVNDILRQRVAGLEEVYEDEKHIYMVVEYCEGGDLYAHLALRETFTEDYVRQIMRPIFEGVKALHDVGIAHRDLKPENLLFKENNKLAKLADSDTPDIKICDFGSSALFAPGQTTSKPFCDFVAT
eukprot:CAMPEP_0118952564 /NCGR_PEP_ID=MMETSP1169-20130426/55088_1 /TAXON_ID=36882 /ORGANISM="Pyramimonas obovata, Strain CCMP722" /LENGTH=239 /DNA_ID=CAMNT_0006899851 /DNA_START=256 /DNA_END=972 /DNA_ORIENTATION=-